MQLTCYFPVGNIVDVTLSSAGSKVIMLHSSAGYSCGYGFWYQLRGEVWLQLQTLTGGEVVWEAEGDTHQQWVQVSLQCAHFMMCMELHWVRDMEGLLADDSSLLCAWDSL